MTEEASPHRPWRFGRWGWAALGAGAVAAGALVWTFGPGAPSLVAALADGRDIWRLGKLRVEGVTGASLGELRAQKLTLADAGGVWAELSGVRVEWSPIGLLINRVDIRSIEAAEIVIARRPQLSPPRPPGFFRPDAHIGAMRAARIDLAEPVAGRPARMRFEGALDVVDRDLARLAFDFASLEGDADRLSLRYRMTPGEIGGFALRGAPGGFFAAALGVEDAILVDAHATGDGDGDARLRGAIGETVFATGSANWSARASRGELVFNADAAPAFAEIAQRIGARLEVSLRGEGPPAQRISHIAARADNLDIRAQGQLTEEGRVRGAVRARIATPDVRRLFPWLAILARGHVAIEGEWRFPRGGARFVGRGEVRDVGVAGVGVTGAGPLTLSWNARAVDIAPNLTIAVDADPMVERLLADARLAGRLRYDRRAARLDVRTAALDSHALRVDASGSVGDERGALSGRWRAMRLAAASENIGGTASGAWRVERGEDALWRLNVEGAAAGFEARSELVAQLLGRTPRAELDALFVDAGLSLRRAALNGAKLRAGASGLVGERLDLRWEASARGPLRLGAAEIAGVADATGRLAGPRARPRLEAQAHMERFDLAGAAIERPGFTVAYDFAARTGEASVNGLFAGAAARAEAELSLRDNALAFNNLTASAFGFDARGEAALADAGPSLNLIFLGGLSHFSPDATGEILGTARLTAARGAPPQLELAADTRQSQFGELRIAHARLSLQGPLGDLRARAEMRGATGDSPLALDAQGGVVTNRNATVATLEARGHINGATLATRAPARFVFNEEGLNAEASMTAGAGTADFTWRGDRRRFTANARFDRAELTPLAAIAGRRAEGTLSGDVRLASAGEALTGGAQLSIDGARLPARMRAPLDVRVDARLEPQRISGSLVARSSSGLDARIEGAAPVETRARPLRIALAAGGEGRAEWRASGPADALWSLIGGLDQNLAGDVSGAGRLRFTADTLTGAGDLTLANGRFEDKRAGLDLRDVAARLEFSETGASRFTLSARDENGGRLTGQGAARGMADGRIDLSLSTLRIIDNEDMNAVASGSMALVWTQAGAQLTGALTLDRAQVTLATREEAGIPLIDVIEINRPEDRAPPPRPPPPGPSAALDLALTAPGRIYTRGRGLDAEWSLDAHLRGTSAAPVLYGEARLVRGEFDLAGQRFELSRGRIRLDGPIDNATIDMLAERTTPDLTARIAVAGDLMDPTITLSSVPALPEDEILPQILFGRSAEDLSALEGAQLAASLAALTGSAAFDIAGMARAAIGLDRLDVREDADGLIVTGGRYLTRDVYLELSRSGLGEAGTRVEWRVRPRLSLVTSFLANGDQRASVRWRRDY